MRNSLLAPPQRRGNRAFARGGLAAFAFGAIAALTTVLWSSQLLSSGLPPQEPSAATLARGEQLYRGFQCAECHGPSGEGDFGPPLVGTDATWEIFRRHIRGGFGWYMPAYAEDEISDDRLSDVWAWLKSLEDDGGSVATAEEQRSPERAHFHHVHLNVTDPGETIAFYVKFFGANRVRYRDRSDALFTERSFILLSDVNSPPRSNLGSTLWHIGWAGVDGQSEFDWRTREGIEVQTPITPLGREFYMYFWGPDREVIEVFTGSKNHRFEHVHLLSSDVVATLDWFTENLGAAPRGPTATYPNGQILWNVIRIDNVNLIVFGIPPPDRPRPSWYPEEMGTELLPSDGTAIDHIGFSFRDIQPAYDQMVAAGVEIVRTIETSPEYGLTSFFVAGPDGLLIEIVEEEPIPEGIWQRRPDPRPAATGGDKWR